MEKRFAALRIIGTVYKILGGIAGALTLLMLLGICATTLLGGAFVRGLGGNFGDSISGFFTAIIMSVMVIVYGGGVAVTLYAFGEGVYLLLALEENTRATMIVLQGYPQAKNLLNDEEAS